ncbi:MAG TPA: hypothetical protein VFK36_12945, partial [Gemmatimonadales bacterium]|nr:hypothetical protein [Gemmatimonadales bacterium]
MTGISRLLPLLLAAVVACSDAAGNSTATVTDSAGVQIVTSAAPAWADGKGWVIDSLPTLDIGGSDSDPHYDLLRVNGATRLKDGHIAVLSAGSLQLMIYDSTGTWISSSGRDGEGPGEFRYPFTLFRFAGDTLVTYDSQLRRVSRFGHDGTFLNSVSTSQAAGGVYVVPVAHLADGSWLGRTSAGFTPDTKPGAMRQPQTLLRLTPAMGPETDTLTTVAGSESWIVTGGSGKQRFAQIYDVPLGYSSWFTTHDSLVYVGDNERYTINVLRPDGSVLRSIRRAGELPPVTAEMRDRLKADFLDGVPAAELAEQTAIWDAFPKHERMPAYDDFMVDADGNLWVMRARVLRPDPATADVFDPSG